MKQHWHVRPLPPPDDSYSRPDGFVTFALSALLVIGPLIYFGPQLGAAERWLLNIVRLVETSLVPLRDWLFS